MVDNQTDIVKVLLLAKENPNNTYTFEEIVALFKPKYSWLKVSRLRKSWSRKQSKAKSSIVDLSTNTVSAVDTISTTSQFNRLSNANDSVDLSDDTVSTTGIINNSTQSNRLSNADETVDLSDDTVSTIGIINSISSRSNRLLHANETVDLSDDTVSTAGTINNSSQCNHLSNTNETVDLSDDTVSTAGTINSTNSQCNRLSNANIKKTVNMSDDTTSTNGTINSSPSANETVIPILSPTDVPARLQSNYSTNRVKPTGGRPVGSTDKNKRKKQLKHEFLQKAICQLYV